MALGPGTRLGVYEILTLLGSGGMGEVYRARDTKLHRDVALKILRADVMADAERLQRFAREAQALAALNHPHIAQIYGIEDTTGVHALVMELVEGEDLARRLARGAIPIDEAIPIARQIAEALEAAHEVGIIHRDLKPANVKVRADGTVKVLDFGLAKAVDVAGQSGADDPSSPTITSPAAMTAAGVILGTAAYMSPEQARGRAVDKRADIWAFGVVLYEMLAGGRAFPGDTVTDVIAAVVTREPDWAALPRGVPTAVSRLLERCLEKDHRVRLRDIGEARVALANVGAADAAADFGTPAATKRSVARRAVPWAVAALAAIAGVSAWVLRPAPAAPLRKLELSLPPYGRNFTLSPDGKRVAFFARGRVWTTDLERLESRDLAPAPPAQRNFAFWSPDSAFVGYNTGDGNVWAVPANGGTARFVCTIPESRQLMGVTWRRDGSIVLAVWRGSLYQVAASEGKPTPLVTIDPAKEIDFHFPVALPDGRVVTATHLTPPPGDASPRTSGAAIADTYRLEIIEGSRRETVLGTGFFPIAYVDAGYLLVQRFDVNQGVWALPFSGRGPLRVEDGFLVAPGAGLPSAAGSSALLYSLASSAPQTRELVWVDRTGRITGQIGPAQIDLAAPALSPDGRHVAFAARIDDNVDIWIRHIDRGTQSRLTFEAGEEATPVWFPTGRRFAYVEDRGGVTGSRIAARSADGLGSRVELGIGRQPVVSHDGRYLVLLVDERGSQHVRYSSISADGTLSPPVRLFTSSPEPNVIAASLSPDGNFLAYVEREASGLLEVFVTTFPSGKGRWQISTGGGRAAVWARNGELFFLGGAADGPKQMMATPMTLGATLVAGSPVKLFDIPADIDTNYLVACFDVAADGKGLVMMRRAGAGGQLAPRWVLVQNWLSEFQPHKR